MTDFMLLSGIHKVSGGFPVWFAGNPFLLQRTGVNAIIIK